MASAAAAAPPSSPGAKRPNTTSMASPMNLSTKPPHARTHSVMIEKYWFSVATTSPGAMPLGDGGEAAQIGEQHRGAAHLAAQMQLAGEQQVAHRRLDDAAEGLQDAILLLQRRWPWR